MLIAILSDSHDHIVHLDRAVTIANSKGAQLLIHCGDLISPFMLPYLERFSGQVHFIYGNNVGDQHLISSRCKEENTNINHHGTTGKITVENIRIGFNHYPELARGLAQSGNYDLVCCGHNHLCSIERIDKCFLLNPGDLLGKDDPPGFLLFNIHSRQAERIIVGSQVDTSTTFTPSSQTIPVCY